MKTKNEYTAIIKQEHDRYIGWIKEIPGGNCQERSVEELKETLKITLSEALEFNRRDAIKFAGNVYREEKITVPM